MKTLFLSLTIGAILGQVPHAYWSLDRYNRITQNWMRISQNVVFCSLISVGIFAFVLIENHTMALIGAVVEILINLYYYSNQFRNIQKPFQKHWLAYLLAVLLPMTIYFFSLEYARL